ncbi:23S rRNA m(5)U-1939 methyltransferase [Schleiferia thermophila]|uniref:23S rRNA m(5)U-1939 methyltransferase n=2 Tax=Schleiferia thermophila TaxID=884107 RepID=A0A369A8I4_9FLAO|nr:23S rRNA m(5)U-1939 methyltransferase [Schleiferia thermophila]
MPYQHPMTKKFKKGDLIPHLEVSAAGAQGKAIARTSQGQVVFIPYAVPGDIIDAEVVQSKKNYLEARIVHLHTPSPHRTSPPCTHFGLCGGCKWQHMHYQAQLQWKQQEVTNNLLHLGKLSLPEPDPILASSSTFGYRNKVEYSFSSMRWLTEQQITEGRSLDRRALGFHIPGRWDRVLHIEHCHLHDSFTNQIRNYLFHYAIDHHLSFWHPKEQTGLLRTLTLRYTTTGQYMVILQFGHNDTSAIHRLLDSLLQTFPQLTTLLYAINTKGNDALYDLDLVCYHGPGYIEEQMPAYNARHQPLIFRISPKSFYQTNSHQATQLYRRALDYLRPTGTELVYDLYTGTGTIALYMARYVRKVIGVELVPDAIADAHTNALLNQITNTTFIAGDIKQTFTPVFIATHGNPDAIIVDPPRDGMHPDVVNTLLRLAPPAIVYISCNSATQARDLAMLSSRYSIIRYGAVDMFPHTHHVESVALLHRQD